MPAFRGAGSLEWLVALVPNQPSFQKKLVSPPTTFRGREIDGWMKNHQLHFPISASPQQQNATKIREFIYRYLLQAMSGDGKKASVRVREAVKADCPEIIRLIQVKKGQNKELPPGM